MFLKSSIGKIVSLTELNQGRYLNKKGIIDSVFRVRSSIYSACRSYHEYRRLCLSVRRVRLCWCEPRVRLCVYADGDREIKYQGQLKGVWHEIFDSRFFPWFMNEFPPGTWVCQWGHFKCLRKVTLCLSDVFSWSPVSTILGDKLSPVSVTPAIKPCLRFWSIPGQWRLTYRR